ncbi:hypothetical protein [Paenibacillus sp. GCM10012303]|uniref:hypothetical protein n=1 Tax=Paenibacillus sp. GCM10012303 TaxID=3317340 RepID=UPI00360742C8
MKRIVTAIVLLFQLIWLSAVGAEPSIIRNSDSDNWDKPAAVSFEAFKTSTDVFAAAARFEWTDRQLSSIKHEHYIRFPAFEFRSDRPDELEPQAIFTNVPAAKFERVPENSSEGYRIKATIWDPEQLRADTPYFVRTFWKRSGNDETHQVTIESLQRFAQPNGSVNDLPDTSDKISSVSWNNSQEVQWPTERYTSEDPVIRYYGPQKKPTAAKIKSDAAYINSKEALKQYRNNANSKSDTIPEQYAQFAITFDRKDVSNMIERLITDYGIEITQIYATAVGYDDKLYTISWFGSDYKNPPEFGSEVRFKSFYITELEGYAHGSDLLEIQDFLDNGIIEWTDKRGYNPTGIKTWLERFGRN